MDGQPDDKENLNCVYLASTAMLYWRDANCSASMYFICESPFVEPEPDKGSAHGLTHFHLGLLLTFVMITLTKLH